MRVRPVEARPQDHLQIITTVTRALRQLQVNSWTLVRARSPVGKKRHAWVLGRPDDEHGTWIAHCLDLDVSAAGESIWDALDAVERAVSKALREDTKRGREPFDRPRASHSEWDRLWRIVHGGILVTEEDLALANTPLDVIATQLTIDVSHAVQVRRAPAALVPAESWRLTG